MNKFCISFLLLVSVCLTVRAAPLTNQLKELVKAMSRGQGTDKVEQTAPADMQRHVLVPRQEAPTEDVGGRKVSVDLEPNVIDDVKNSPLAPIFHPEFMLNGP